MIRELTFKEYHEEALSTSVCPENMDVIYPMIGLSGETGEIYKELRAKLIKE